MTEPTRSKSGPRPRPAGSAQLSVAGEAKSGPTPPARGEGRKRTARRDTDRLIAGFARRQHGLVTTRQLLGAGVASSAIARRAAQGRLHRTHHGVYLVGHEVAPRFAPELAAVLACGPHAALSHRSAAGVWSIRPSPDGDVEVTVRSRGRAPRPGIRVHRSRTLETCERTTTHGVPITTPLRTVFDLATTVSGGELERAVAEALARGLLTRSRLRGALDDEPRRRGAAKLRDLLQLDHHPAFTRSRAERRFLALIRRAQLPSARANAKVLRFEVDFWWPEEGLAVEVDSYGFHTSRAAFENDRRRDAELGAAGIRVLRVTRNQIVHAPEAVAAHVGAALALARAARRQGFGPRPSG